MISVLELRASATELATFSISAMDMRSKRFALICWPNKELNASILQEGRGKEELTSEKINLSKTDKQESKTYATGDDC